MVDSANILAEITAGHYRNGKFDLSFLADSMQRVVKRQPRARIYKLLKNKIDADIYVTDNQGIILFNSKKPKSAGRSFAGWNDVNKWKCNELALSKHFQTICSFYVFGRDNQACSGLIRPSLLCHNWDSGVICFRAFAVGARRL